MSAAQATEIYPVNYRPRVTDYSLEYAALNADLSDVAIVEVPHDAKGAHAVIESLNATLNETTAEWFFLCDSSFTADERNYSAARLLAHARLTTTSCSPTRQAPTSSPRS